MRRKRVIDGVRKAVRELVRKYPDKIIAVGLFGSVARGDYTEKSDVDILVIVKDWSEGMTRRYAIYDVFFGSIKTDVTIVDINYEDAEKILSGEIPLTSSMLNVLYDCIVIYDPHKILRKLVNSIKELVRDLGLMRYKIGHAYGWKKNGKTKIRPK